MGYVVITAKPTKYRGVTFRSKLESDWARFLDRQGTEWEYEPRAFSTTLGCYLPDFWLPYLSMWAEVKPTELDKVALTKIMDVSSQTGNNSLLLEGPPKHKVRMVEHCGDIQALHLYNGLHVVYFNLGGRKCL